VSGTSAKRAKKALIDGIRVLFAATPSTADVTVTYGYRGHEHTREFVHAGRAFGPQSYPVMGGGGARFKRDETLTIKLHIVVEIPGGDQEEAEDRVTAIGTVFEEWLAATASLPGYTPGEVISVGITAVDLDTDTDDDSALTLLTYDVEVNTRLS
jgi:hypothetical protein